MKTKTILIVAVVVVLAALGIGKLLLGTKTSNVMTDRTATVDPGNASSGGAAVSSSASDASPAASTTLPAMRSTGQLFKDSPDYQYAYRIFPTLVSGAAKQALSGFDMKTTDLGNNTYRVDLTTRESQYHSQSFTVMGDQKIYFIERSLGDDSGNNDLVYGDDHAVAVDARGYILQ